MIDSSSPIGVFDSGLGGLSVLKNMISLMPEENFIYYGDSANNPYGTKTEKEIKELSFSCVDFLLNKNAKAIVIACNTATSVAANSLREKYPQIPIVGIEPALKPAVLWKKNDKVIVMATPATLNLNKFQSLLHTYDNDAEIYSVPCHGLPEIVERGELDTPETEQFLKKILSPYLSQNIDAIVLGCTHYPFVKKAIERIVGPEVKIFDGSYGTAKELKHQLIAHNIKQKGSSTGYVEIYNSSELPEMLERSNMLLYGDY